MAKSILFIIFSLAIINSTFSQDARYYVSASATGANNGQSWTDAFTDLQSALQQANAGDEIWVAQGIYYPTATINQDIAFEPKSGVRLYGGFAGTENSLDERDWDLYQTVLSGDIGIQADSTDNSYTVMYLHQPDSNTIIDGLVLRYGAAIYSGSDAQALDRRKSGGGLYIMAFDADAYAEIRNCKIEHNSAFFAGGGVLVNGGGDGSIAPRFWNCTISDNYAGFDGGGMARYGASWVERTPDMDSCIFKGNYAARNGGGLYLVDADRTDDFQLNRLHFIENKSLGFGGGAMINLGRLDGSTGCYLSGCEFIKNASEKRNAAIYVAARLFLNISNINLDKCSFIENDTLPGIGLPGGTADGVATILSSSPSIIQCTFNKNINKTAGQILIVETIDDSKCDIEDCIFSNNYNTEFLVKINSKKISIAKCFFNKNNSKAYLSLGSIDTTDIISSILLNNEHATFPVFISNRAVTISNSLIVEPSNGVPLTSTFTQSSSPLFGLQFRNSIILGGSRLKQAFSLLTYNQITHISHSYFDTLDCSTLPQNITCGPGILTGIDPLFVNPDSGDFRLQACSPLINAGSNDYVMSATDLAGLPRIRGGTVDIGAYESQGPALAVAPLVTASCPGGNSGAVEAELQDACLPVVYHWQAGASSGNQLNGLPPGDYQFTITDAKGQTGTFSVLVPEGVAPDLLPIATPLLCGDTLGGTGTAALNPATSPLQYLWAGGSTDSLRSGLAAGSYALTITDANGCTASGTVQVDKTGSLDIDIEGQEISCHGAADGVFTVLPTNGKAPFNWSWESGAVTPSLGPLGPGTYQGTLTDALGCSIQWVLPLGEPGPLAPNAVVTDAQDSAAANGRIALLPSGGTAPYDILWNTGASGPLLDSLLPGIYTATLTDANGCMVVETITVGVTSGTDEAMAGSEFQLYPNPATGLVWLVLDQPFYEDLPVRLLNIAGQEVLSTRIPANTERLLMSVVELPQGPYFVKIGERMHKLMIR